MRQQGFAKAVPGKKAQPVYPVSANCGNAQSVKSLEGPPAQKTAAKCITGLSLAFEHDWPGTSLGEHDGSGGPGRTAADDQRIDSTHNRNGKVRNIRAFTTSASASIFFINSASFFAAASRPPSPKASANATAAPIASAPKA